MSIKADLITNDVDSVGDKFSDELLKKFAKQSVGLPITVNFQHDKPAVGRITNAELIDGRVEIEANLDSSLEQKFLALMKEDISPITYVGIGCTIEESHMEGEIRVIDKGTLYETSLLPGPTMHPRQRPIFQIKIDDEDKSS